METIEAAGGEALAEIEIFEGLSPAERERVAQSCQWRRYGPNEQIIRYQDRTRDVYFIASGNVRATIYSASGKEVTFRDLNAGEIFGELSAIDAEPRTAYVVALTPTTVASLSAESFWEVLLTHPSVAAAAFKRLTRLIRLLCDRVVEFSTLPVRTRLHVELLRMAHQHMRSANSAAISPLPTHAEIANRLSTVREAVSRELAQLTHGGLIERSGDTLLVHDVEALHRLVAEAQNR